MKLILNFMILIALFLFSCGQNNDGMVGSSAYNLMLRNLLDHSVEEISVSELSENYHQYTLLDAREKPEYEVSHMTNAIWVGYDKFDRNKLNGVDKDAPIVVYCSVGYRSEKIANQLTYLGYTNVKNLYGGIFEWVNQKQPIYDEFGETDRVHAYNKAWGIWLKNGDKVYE
jgi:rhodanese-related sulfurtransferase